MKFKIWEFWEACANIYLEILSFVKKKKYIVTTHVWWQSRGCGFLEEINSTKKEDETTLNKCIYSSINISFTSKYVERSQELFFTWDYDMMYGFR